METTRLVHRLLLLEPLELGYVAAAVPAGHDVRVLDLRLSRWPDWTLGRTLRRWKPDLVGVSGYTHETLAVLKVARRVRSLLPRAFVVVGGHHATVLPGDFNVDSVDAIVRGEGCAPFRAVVEAAAAGRGFAGIPNVLVPGAGFDEKAAAELPRYPDLAEVPTPRRDLWDPKRYWCVWPSEKHPDWASFFPRTALVRTSYGCQMTCTFCVVPRLSGRRHLTRPVESVVREIESIPNEHVYFCDDETFLNGLYARELAEGIRARGIRKKFFAWTRSTTVKRSPELFRLWREVGLDAVFLGFEAASDEELKDISKHSTVVDNERALVALRGMGIAVHAGFMVQAWFTHEDFDRLERYVEGLPQAQVTFTVYTPSPGSQAWNEERSGFVADPVTLHDCMHPLAPTAIPLREFFDRFARLMELGARRNPLRADGIKPRPHEIPRILLAHRAYLRGLRRAYRDYPRHLW
jgi:radical SAM superfamily enzyme YgiQ (UPF0313 family)